MITITVRYFAAAKERAGVACETVDVDATLTIAALRPLLAARHPQLAPLLGICRLGCNDAFAEETDLLAAGDDVLVLPPSAGGAPRAQLLDVPLQLGQAERLCDGDGVGGVVTFVGTVRRENRGKSVTRLEYTAYAPLAISEMEAIAAEAMARWPLRDVQVLHRVGVLEVGDVAVQIAVAAGHRAEAFAACAWVIDAIKARVPIWKKEWTSDGEEWLGSTP